jgi:hypothetical protein
MYIHHLLTITDTLIIRHPKCYYIAGAGMLPEEQYAHENWQRIALSNYKYGASV